MSAVGPPALRRSRSKVHPAHSFLLGSWLPNRFTANTRLPLPGSIWHLRGSVCGVWQLYYGWQRIRGVYSASVACVRARVLALQYMCIHAALTADVERVRIDEAIQPARQHAALTADVERVDSVITERRV